MLEEEQASGTGILHSLIKLGTSRSPNLIILLGGAVVLLERLSVECVLVGEAAGGRFCDSSETISSCLSQILRIFVARSSLLSALRQVTN